MEQIQTLSLASLPGLPPLSALTVILATRRLTLQCANAAEAAEWLGALCTAKGTALDSGGEAAAFDLRRSPQGTAEKQVSQFPPLPGMACPSPERSHPPVSPDHLTAALSPPRSAPEETTYTRVWDEGNAAYYFCTCDEAWWALPMRSSEGEWVQVWDHDLQLPFRMHSATGEEEWQASAFEGWDPQTTWVEEWDDQWQAPYYVQCSTGQSTWDWPEGALVLQCGTPAHSAWMQAHVALDDAGVVQKEGDSMVPSSMSRLTERAAPLAPIPANKQQLVSGAPQKVRQQLSRQAN